MNGRDYPVRSSYILRRIHINWLCPILCKVRLSLQLLPLAAKDLGVSETGVEARGSQGPLFITSQQGKREANSNLGNQGHEE